MRTFLGLAILALAAACGDSPTSPATTEPATTATELFGSQISSFGTASRSFTVPKDGTVTIQLTSMSQADAIVRLGLGVQDGLTCTITQSVDTVANAAASSPQITAALTKGTYCAKISDIGNLANITTFSISIVRPVA